MTSLPIRPRAAHGPVLALVALLASPLWACTSAQDVQCETDEHCNRGAEGECTMSATGSSWCSYADSTCSSGRRWSDLDVGEGLEGDCVGDNAVADAGSDPDGLVIDAPVGIDAGTDAGAPAFDAAPTWDATPIIAWDIAYVNDLRSGDSGDFSVIPIARIINTGTAPLDLAKIVVDTVGHDGDPGMNVMVNGLGGGGFILPPGQAAGVLDSDEGNVINPLITEPTFDNSLELLQISASNTDPGTDADYGITATVRIQGLAATLSIAVDDLASGAGGVYFPNSAERISAQ